MLRNYVKVLSRFLLYWKEKKNLEENNGFKICVCGKVPSVDNECVTLDYFLTTLGGGVQ